MQGNSPKQDLPIIPVPGLMYSTARILMIDAGKPRRISWQSQLVQFILNSFSPHHVVITYFNFTFHLFLKEQNVNVTH